jgi:hypothetical protein
VLRFSSFIKTVYLLEMTLRSLVESYQRVGESGISCLQGAQCKQQVFPKRCCLFARNKKRHITEDRTIDSTRLRMSGAIPPFLLQYIPWMAWTGKYFTFTVLMNESEHFQQNNKIKWHNFPKIRERIRASKTFQFCYRAFRMIKVRVIKAAVINTYTL